ncbi:hypothetical protein SRHO_G00251980 [Serrasalmus rhombeus]
MSADWGQGHWLFSVWSPELQVRGRDRTITDLCDAVKAFQVKLLLWEKQKHQSNLPHFPCCQVKLNQVGATLFINTRFADKRSSVRAELARRFGDFEKQKDFAVDVETAPVQIQMELIELQCNETLKAKDDAAGPPELIHSSPAPPTCGSNLHVWWHISV